MDYTFRFRSDYLFGLLKDNTRPISVDETDDLIYFLFVLT